jgi:hypothetical protein
VKSPSLFAGISIAAAGIARAHDYQVRDGVAAGDLPDGRPAIYSHRLIRSLFTRTIAGSPNAAPAHRRLPGAGQGAMRTPAKALPTSADQDASGCAA